MTKNGLARRAILTQGFISGRDPAPTLAEVVTGGSCLADLRYCGTALQIQLWYDGEVLLLTPADGVAGQAKALVSSLRERIETIFLHLLSSFVDRVYPCSWNGMRATIKLKILHFNPASTGLILD